AERQLALRADGLHVARLARGWQKARSPAKARPYALRIARPGLIDGVALAEDRPPPGPGAGEVRIAVAASGVNFLDVLSILGAVPDDAPAHGPFTRGPPLGWEVAGRIA